jgi:hypothetical protein
VSATDLCWRAVLGTEPSVFAISSSESEPAAARSLPPRRCSNPFFCCAAVLRQCQAPSGTCELALRIPAMREAARGGSTGAKIVRENKGVINHTLLALYRADTMRGVGRTALQDPPTSRRTCKLTLCRINHKVYPRFPHHITRDVGNRRAGKAGFPGPNHDHVAVPVHEVRVHVVSATAGSTGSPLHCAACSVPGLVLQAPTRLQHRKAFHAS